MQPRRVKIDVLMWNDLTDEKLWEVQVLKCGSQGRTGGKQCGRRRRCSVTKLSRRNSLPSAPVGTEISCQEEERQRLAQEAAVEKARREAAARPAAAGHLRDFVLPQATNIGVFVLAMGSSHDFFLC